MTSCLPPKPPPTRLQNTRSWSGRRSNRWDSLTFAIDGDCELVRTCSRPSSIHAIEPCVSRWACWTRGEKYVPSWITSASAKPACDVADLAVQFEQDVVHLSWTNGSSYLCNCGAPSAIASSGSKTAGSTSYSTTTLRHPSSAAPTESASTATTRWPDEPHDVVEDVGVVGIHQVVGVDRCGEALPRNVLPRVHAVHAGNRERGGLVDRDDARVGVRGVQHLEVQHALHLGVHGELRRPGHHAGGRGRADAGADGLPGRRFLDRPTPLTASSIAR